jgi:hypothetical protein
MGQSQHTRLWLAIAGAALLALTAAIWLPAILPLGASQSPLPIPVAAAPLDASGAPISPLAKAGWTLLWVGLGVVLGLGVVFVSLYWHRRSTK